jgi:hypothetical protein
MVAEPKRFGEKLSRLVFRHHVLYGRAPARFPVKAVRLRLTPAFMKAGAQTKSARP